MNADSASCSLAMKRVNAQFNTVFGRLTKRRIFPFRQNQLNSTLPGNWVAFRPARANDHLGAISATLPRLCAKCRGSSCAAKLPDPFPQRTSSGCVWFRYNADLERGQVCVPSVRDAKLGEIYKCQLCGKLMLHPAKGGQVGMYQIFEDLAAEIEKLYYSKDDTSKSAVASKKIIPFKHYDPMNHEIRVGQAHVRNKLKFGDFVHQVPISSYGDVTLNHGENKKPSATYAEWELLIGNIFNYNRPPSRLEELIDAKHLNNHKKSINKKPRKSASPEPLIFTTKTGADLSEYECSFDIWEQKAKERRNRDPSVRFNDVAQPLPQLREPIMQKLYVAKPIPKLMDICVPEPGDALFTKNKIYECSVYEKKPLSSESPMILLEQRFKKESPLITKLLEQQCNLSKQVAEWVLDDQDLDARAEEEKGVPCTPEPDQAKLEEIGHQEDEGYEDSDQDQNDDPEPNDFNDEESICENANKVGNLYTKTFCITTAVTVICFFITFLQASILC